EERNSLADFLVALAAFDRQRGWAALGYATLFQYLERELKLTSSAAARRMTAAGLVLRFPAVVEPLRDGRICMSVVYELAKAVTPENVREVLPRFYGLSKREAEALVAELKPVAQPPRREVVTSVARAVQPALGATASVPERTSPAESERVPPAAAGDLFSAPARPRDEVEPLDADLRRYHLTVSKAFLAKLAAAKDALSHAVPDGDTEAVLSAALDLLLEQAAKRRGLVEKPRPTPPRPSSDPRHVPAAVAREVWKRDGGRCAFPLPDGAVCGSTTRLQLDHVIAVALGGGSEPTNLRVACERHNQLAARQAFGDLWMDQFARKRPPEAGARET
ncbi:MAG TPA: HNH endonuclease signature motif containing protein, partial [Anaeromyxobacteraceae bacterium]